MTLNLLSTGFFTERQKRNMGSAASHLTPREAAEDAGIRNLVARALRAGILVRPGSCSECGKVCTPDGHHEDYSKPREVKWLCHLCHIERHRVLRAEAKHQRRDLKRQAKLAARRAEAEAEAERIVEAWEKIGECSDKRSARIINQHLAKSGRFRCKQCHRVLPLELKERTKGGGRCKPCASTAATRWSEEFKARDPEGYRAYRKHYNELARQNKQPEATQ